MKLLKLLLLPLSILFGIIIRIRNFFYDNKLFNSYKPSVFTVCIGNITVGGTGKTPVLLSIIQNLKQYKYKIAVLSRGYKRKSTGLYLVSNYDKIVGNQEKSGDEPYLIAQEAQTLVVCCADRIEGIEYLKNNFKPDLILLDDGFQHRRVKNSFNLLLIDSPRFLGNRFFIPTGILRDNVYRFNQSNIIILTKITNDNLKTIKQLTYLKQFNKKILLADFTNTNIYNDFENIAIDELNNKKIFFFAALGNPDKIINDLQQIAEVKYKLFTDHYDYIENDLNKIINEANFNECKYILTTSKDYVKIKQFNLSSKILIIDLKVNFLSLYKDPINLADIIKNEYLKSKND